MRLNSPIGPQSLDRLVDIVAQSRPASVLDHGCGWGEMLLRILEAVPDARGTGIDVHEPDIERARANADTRGLADRARFITGSSENCTDAADLVINVGSYQAFGTVADALARLHHSTKPSGRLVFGAEHWVSIPTADQLAHMWEGTTVDDCLLLPDLIELVTRSGWRVMDLRTSTIQEWEEFETGHLLHRESWLIANPTHPAAAEIRNELDATRSAWLRGHRDVMGFVVLVLAPDHLPTSGQLSNCPE